jgi:hypothetical protein
MTKNLLSVIALTVLMLAGNVSKAQDVQLGIRGGMNYSTLRGFDDLSPNFRTLPSAGASIVLKGNGNWSYSFDILYSQRGVTYSSEISDTVFTEKFNYKELLHYVEIPVLFNYSFLSDSSRFRPRVFVGPSLNIRTKGTRTLNYNKSTADSVFADFEQLTDLNLTYSPIDYGVVFGAGLSFDVTDNLVASFDARFNYGLLDIRERISNFSPKIANLHANFLIGIHYKIGTGKKKSGGTASEPAIITE